MKLQSSTLALALAAAFAASGAHAAMSLPNNTTQGNSSVVFIAMDVNDSIGLVIDLGLQMSAFTNSTDLTSGLAGPITWDFSADTTTAPGVTGTNGWSTAYELFKATQSGGDFRWGVVAGDQITGTSITGTNAIPGRGLLATGNATEAQMLAASTSGPTGTALGNLLNWMAGNNNLGSHSTVDNGANTNTPADAAWNNDLMKDNFNGSLTWSYLLLNGESSTFQWQQQLVANPIVNQFGNPSSVDSLSAAPITFTFDIATNQLVLAPVPEPGTYAMLLAGMGVLGFMARRRKG